MNFDEAVNCIIENQQEKHMFILIDPSEYQSVIFSDEWISQQYGYTSVPDYEYFKVITPNEEGENLVRIKRQRSKELPEEIDDTWVKTSMMFGGDVKRYTGRDTRGNFIKTNSNYIVLSPHKYSKSEVFTAYLEPAESFRDYTSKETADDFSKLMDEL